jgi:hypothetical protein
MPRFTHTCDASPHLRRAGLRCRIVARGALNTIAVEIEGGPVVVTSRDRIHRIQEPPRSGGPELAQLARIAALAAPHGWDSEDVLFIGWECQAIPWIDSLSDLTRLQAYALIACLENISAPALNESAYKGAPN